MTPLNGFDLLGDRIWRFIGRLPPHVAYPLIFVGSVILWSLIGVAAGAILRRYVL